MTSYINFRSLYFIFGILVAINFWSYVDLDVAVFANRSTVFLFVISSLLILSENKNRRCKKDVFHLTMKWTLVTIFISIFPAYFDSGQPLLVSIKTCMSLSFGILYYFLLKKWQYPEEQIIKTLTYICLIWVILEIGQQFTYPKVLFSNALLKIGYVSERMGLYRVYIWGIDFVMIIFSYYLGRTVSTKRTRIDILLLLIFFVGIMAYCSRKHILTCLITIVFSILNVKGATKWIYLLFVGSILGFLYINFYDSYHEMNAIAQESQGEGEDFVRFISAKYFLFDYSSSILYPLWGGGIPGGEGNLHNLMERLADMRIYQADTGIIGYYSMVGVLGVSAIFMYIFIFLKNWRNIDDWFKYFFIMKLIMIFFDFWAVWGVGMFAYALFIYLLDNNIKKNKALRKNENRNFNVL